MPKLSLRKASEQFDVSRPTLSKALKSGKISGEQDASGQWLVDVSELARVYKVRASFTGKDDGDLSTDNRGLPDNLHGVAQAGNLNKTQHADDLAELRAKLAEAEKRAAVAEALAEERAKRIDDLRRLLPGPDEKPATRRSWWPWGS